MKQYEGVNIMAILRLVGAKRFMNKRANPNVMLMGDATNDLQDEALVNALLGQSTIDPLGNPHPMFEVVEPEVKLPVKKKATRKKRVSTKTPVVENTGAE